MLKMSNSESEKMEGSSVLGSRLSEKVDHLPIKKRRFMFREPSPPPVDTLSPERTESVAPCLNSVSQEEQAKTEASCPPVASLTVSDLRQSGDTDSKVEEEKVVNEREKASEDEDTSKRALVDRPASSNDTQSREVFATVKLEPNSVNLPEMSAKETDSRSLKSHSENVTSSALDCSSLGKATLDNAHTPLGLEHSMMNQVTSKKAIGDEDTSDTPLVDQPACSSDLGGSADMPNQGEGSRIVSDDMMSLKALATVKLEPNSEKLADMSTKQTDSRLSRAPSNDVASFRMDCSSSSKTTVDNLIAHTPLELKCSVMNQVTTNTQKSADVDDRLNWDLNTVMDAWNKQPQVPDQHGNVADAVCRNVAKADEKSIYKESTPVGSEISPVVLKSLTPKIEKSELEPSCNGISKLLSPAMYSAPQVAPNKVFDNVVVPSTLTLEYRASDVSLKPLNANGKGTDNLSRPMASGTNFSLEHCISMSPTKETVAPSSIVGSKNNVSNVTTVQTTDIGELNLSLTPAASLENRVHQSGSTFDEDDKAEIKRAIISNMMTMDKLTGKGTESSENAVSSKTVGFGNNDNASRAITTLQTIENGKLNLSLVTVGSSENKVNQSGNTFDGDDKAQVKRAISMLMMTESSQNGVGSGNNVNNVTVQTTENDKLNLSLTTAASLENTFPHSESTCTEDDKSQVKRAITSNDITIERNSAAPVSSTHDVKCSEKSPVAAFPNNVVNCNKEGCEEPLDNGFANNLVHYNKDVCEEPLDNGYENFPSDIQAGSEVDNIDELSYGYDSRFEDGEQHKESIIQTWEGYEEDREIGHFTDNRGASGAPESPSRIRSTDEISSVLVPEKRVSSDQVSGSEPNETGTGIAEVSMEDASQSAQWKMNVSGSDILPEGRSLSSEITKMRDFSSIQFSSRIDRFGLQTDHLETKAQGSRFYRREPLLRTGEPSTRDAFLSRSRFRMQGCSSNDADDSASRPLRESGGLRSLRRGRGGLTWNRHSPPFPGPSFRRSDENLTKEDQNDDARPGPYVTRQSIRSRLVATSEEDEFRARLGLRPSGETSHNRVVNVGRGRPLRYGSRPNAAGPRGRYFGPPNDEFDEPSLEYSRSFANRRRCENLPCAHHHSGSTSPPRLARSPINDAFRRRSRSPNLRSDTRIRRPLSPSYRRGFEPDRVGGYTAEPRNNNSPPNSRWVKFKERSSVFDRRSPPPGRIENFRSGHPGRFSDLRGGGRGGSRYLGSDGDVTDHGNRRGGFVRRYDMSRPVKHASYDEEDGSGPVFDSRDKEPLEFHGRGNAKPYVNGTDSRFRDLPRRNREERENW